MILGAHLLVMLILWALSMCVLYWVIRSAVRDGFRDATAPPPPGPSPLNRGNNQPL